MTSKSGSGAGGRIDYDRMVADYEAGLVDTLRSFGPAEEYLELWVPDEDPVVSLCNMIDAAGAAGHDAIAVRLGAETAKAVDQSRLRALAGELGDVRMERDGSAVLLDVSGIRKAVGAIPPQRPRASAPGRGRGPAAALSAAAAPRDRRAVYADAIREAGRVIAHQRRLAETDGQVLVGVEEDGVGLQLLVGGRDHVVREAAHQGSRNAEDRAVLDRLCRLIEGKPIQEASDHGVIRLEFDLRRRTGPRPVPGVYTPVADEPPFHLPLRLVRAALDAYRAKTGYAGIDNQYDDPPSPEWLALDDGARRARIAAAIAEVAAANGYSADAVEVVAVELDVRVVLRFCKGLAEPEKQRHMMVLERGVKDRVDDRLELFLDELKDGNVMRRLSGTDEAP